MHNTNDGSSWQEPLARSHRFQRYGRTQPQICTYPHKPNGAEPDLPVVGPLDLTKVVRKAKKPNIFLMSNVQQQIHDPVHALCVAQVLRSHDFDTVITADTDDELLAKGRRRPHV